jgi:sugar lactone lactonase YvrE
MPTGMALDPSGTFLFIADYNNSAIRLVSNVGDTASSTTTTFANATNNGGIAGINHPLAVVVDSATNVYVLNYGTGNNGAVLHLSGIYLNSGLALVYPPLASNLNNATAMAMDGNNNLYVTVNGNTVKRVTPGGVVSTIGTVSQSGTAPARHRGA